MIPPILYSFRRCPYAMRARMALIAAGQSVELREVSLKAKPAEMIAASAKATVPVLVLPDGQIIDQSLDIMRWALTQYDPERWLAFEAEAATLIAINDSAFKHHLDRTKYPHRTPNIDWAGERDAALALLAPLETKLATSAFLCGEERSLADIALFPFIRQFAAIETVEFTALPFPALRRWLGSHVSSPLFETAMVRYPVWMPGDEAVLFP